MNFIIAIEFLTLSMLWGGSYLFMRIAVPEFGPIPLIELRVLFAAIVLLPFALRGDNKKNFQKHWAPISFVGIANAALPFSLLAFATIYLSSGFAAILGATAPFFAALIAYYVFGERLEWLRILGLIIGFSGVAVLIWGRGSLKFSSDGIAIAACLAAALSYGIAANFTKHRLSQVPPILAATGGMWAAAIVLAPLALYFWPTVIPSMRAWLSVALLSIASTALAFILFFRLIAILGPGKTVMVTFLIPIFASIWGALVLSEKLTFGMLLGGFVVLIGVALATGMIGKNILSPKPMTNTMANK